VDVHSHACVKVRMFVRRSGVAADEIFVLVLVAVCASVVVAMELHSRQRAKPNGDVETPPTENEPAGSASPALDDASAAEPRRRKRRKR
jgi:hypothetical protein